VGERGTHPLREWHDARAGWPSASIAAVTRLRRERRPGCRLNSAAPFTARGRATGFAGSTSTISTEASRFWCAVGRYVASQDVCDQRFCLSWHQPLRVGRENWDRLREYRTPFKKTG